MYDLEMHKFSWETSFGYGDDRFVGRRWLANRKITVRNPEDIATLIASTFMGGDPLDEIIFNILEVEGGYAVEFEEYVSKVTLDAYANAIWCKAVISAIPKMDHRQPVKYIASKMGFIWRSDNEIMIEAFDELDKLQEIQSFIVETPSEDS